MSKRIEEKDAEQLLAEADALIQQINTDALRDREEALYLQVEAHAKNLNKIKSEVFAKKKKKRNSGAEGMHAAILEITKALRDLGKYLS